MMHAMTGIRTRIPKIAQYSTTVPAAHLKLPRHQDTTGQIFKIHRILR